MATVPASPHATRRTTREGEARARPHTAPGGRHSGHRLGLSRAVRDQGRRPESAFTSGGPEAITCFAEWSPEGLCAQAGEVPHEVDTGASVQARA